MEKLLSRAVKLDQKQETDAEDGQAADGHPGIYLGSPEGGESGPAQHRGPQDEARRDTAKVSSWLEFHGTLHNFLRCGQS